MKSKLKKFIAPIIVTLITVLIYLLYFCIIATHIEGIWKYIFGIIPLMLAGVMIAVCIERINEIKKGEDDDISKY